MQNKRSVIGFLPNRESVSGLFHCSAAKDALEWDAQSSNWDFCFSIVIRVNIGIPPHSLMRLEPRDTNSPELTKATGGFRKHKKIKLSLQEGWSQPAGFPPPSISESRLLNIHEHSKGQGVSLKE